MAKKKDLFEFTYEIHQMLQKRLMDAYCVKLAQAEPIGYWANFRALPWTDQLWEDVCGKMRKIFLRLEREGLMEPSEYYPIESINEGWEKDLAKYIEDGDWDDLHAMLCHLDHDLYYYSDRWNCWRAYKTERVWEHILYLKAQGQELRNYPKGYNPAP